MLTQLPWDSQSYMIQDKSQSMPHSLISPTTAAHMSISICLDGTQ